MSRNYEISPELRRKIEKKKLARKRQLRRRILVCMSLATVIITGILYKLNVIPHKYYYNSDFGIATYKSQVDKDEDGIDCYKGYIDEQLSFEVKLYLED